MPRERKAKEEKTGYRTDLGLLEAVVSIAGNLFLFTVKLIIGIAIGSMAAIADAVHTFSDIASSIVVFVGFKISGREPDSEHPHGHGRMENIATLVIAVLLVVTGLELVVSAVKRLFAPQVVGGGWWVSAVFIFAALSKEAMARFAFKLGKEIDSEALVADGWHHRADAVSSFLVAAGNIVAVRGWYQVDSLLGAAVAGLVIYTGWKLALSSGNRLLGASPSPEMLAKIREEAVTVEGVNRVHGIQVHDYGFHQEISLHIEVPPGLDLAAAHQVADEVEKKLARVLGAGVVVHVDIDSQAGEPATPPGPAGE
ncbi:MAG: cation transporter [Firmicutes bacterium]|jgi:cation diffusion facilitator family transporter|nr:cation transporter [Bacillota bacterium]